MPTALNPPATVDELLLLDDEAFVRAAYAVVLGRAVDESGLNSFLRLIRQGTSKEQLVVTLANSDEARSRGGAAPMLAELLANHVARPACRVCRFIRRLLADALEPLLQQLRAIDNRLYRLEHAALLRTGIAPAGAGATELAPAKRLIPLDHESSEKLFSTIRSWVRSAPEAAILRQRPDPAALASHDHGAP